MRYFNLFLVLLVLFFASAFTIVQPNVIDNVAYFDTAHYNMTVTPAYAYRNLPSDNIVQEFTINAKNIPDVPLRLAYVFDEPLLYGRLYRGAVDLSSYVDYVEFQGKHIYYTNTPYDIGAFDSLDFSVDYVPSVDAGEWDLYFYSGEATCFLTDSCNIYYKNHPWFNTSFSNKQQINITGVDNSKYVGLVLNSSVINYSLILDNGFDVRFVNGDEDSFISYNRSVYNEGGNSIFYLDNSSFVDGNNSLYIYFNNNTPVDDVSVSFDFIDSIFDGLEFVLELDNNDNDATSNFTFSEVNVNYSSVIKILGTHSFDNTDDSGYILVPDVAKQTATTSWSVWVNPETSTSDDHILSDFSGSEFNLLIFHSSGYLKVYSGNGDGSLNDVWSLGGVAVGSWSHYVLVRDCSNNTEYFYINGSNVASRAVTYCGGNTPSNHFRIGDGYAGSQTFDGYIDEVVVYDTAISSDYVSRLYNSGYGLTFSGFGSNNILYGAVSGDVEFINAVPVLSSYSFTPDTPPESQDLTLSVVYVDADGDDINISIEWFVNGDNILNQSSGFVLNGSSNDFVLDESFFVYLDNVSAVLFAVDNLSGESIINYTSNVSVGGSPTMSIVDLAVVSVGKNWVFLNWSNPTNFNSTKGFINGSLVFNDNVSDYNFTGLTTNTSYNFSFSTISDTFAENTSRVSVVQSTNPNFAPNITGYSPVDLSPIFDEDTTNVFNATAVDDDGVVFFKWLLNGVAQAFTQAWSWVLGYNDEGDYNVTLVVNDSFGAETSLSWAVEVLDTYPVPTGADIYLFGETFRNNIPVSCFEPNSRNMYYDLAVSVNGGSYSTLFVNRSVCDYVFDIDEYSFGANFSFRAKSRNVAGESNYTYSSNVSKARKELFYFYVDDTPKSFVPYDAGFYAQFNNNNSVYIAYAFVDCNGDKVFDYAFDYNSTNSSELYNKINQRFVCVNPKGAFEHNVYLVFGSLSATTDWSSVGCNAKPTDNYCYINKRYRVVVS